MNQIKYLLIAAISLLLVSFSWHKPSLYIIGDSTVRNGDGSGSNRQWGWGTVIANWFDTGRISISTQASLVLR